MYEARQKKEKISKRINGDGSGTRKKLMKSIHNIVQKQSECKGLRFVNYDKLNDPAKRAYNLLKNNREGFRNTPKSDNEVHPQVDSENRVVSIEAMIKGNRAPRNTYLQRIIGHLGNLESGLSRSYNGGHLLCAEQGGMGTWGNMIPQEELENQHGEWYYYERNNTRKYKNCILTVNIEYKGDDVRPMSWESKVIKLGETGKKEEVHAYKKHYFNLDLPTNQIPTNESDCLANKKCRKKSVAWTNDEDMKLKSSFAVYVTEDGTFVANQIGNRSQAQCQKRFDRGLNPGLSKEPWTDDEINKLYECVEKYGETKWLKIAREFGNRSDTQCRYKWSCEKRKQLQNTNSKKKTNSEENSVSFPNWDTIKYFV